MVDCLSSMEFTRGGLFGGEPASVDMWIWHRLIFGSMQQQSLHGVLRLDSSLLGAGRRAGEDAKLR